MRVEVREKYGEGTFGNFSFLFLDGVRGGGNDDGSGCIRDHVTVTNTS